MPFVKEYTNDEKLVQDVQKLKDHGIDNSEVYILSHDDDRTERIASNAKANTIGFSEQDMKNFLNNMFNKKVTNLELNFKKWALVKMKLKNMKKTWMKVKYY